MIRNSIIVATLALLISLLMHMAGILVLFYPGKQPTEEAGAEPANSAAFEDFTQEALQPEEPEPTPEDEPQEVVEPLESSDIQVASDDPQETLTPDTGTEAETLGQIEPTEEVTASAPPVQGADVPTPEGSPEASAEPAPLEADEAPETLEADVAEATDDAPDEALDAAPEIETVEDGEVFAAAVTRSPRPPVSRPSEETLGDPEGEGQTQEPIGVEAGALSQVTGLDILAEAGRTALYGRASFDMARATGNAQNTNYAGKVFTKLNRSLRVYRNEKGFAVIRIQILPDGQVGWIRILRSGGSPSIDIAATANVRKAAPFPRPPSGKPFELNVTFQSK